MARLHSVTPRPKLFVGSSTTGLHIARILSSGLDDVADVTSWCEGDSTAPSAPASSVFDDARSFDAAAFVLSAGFDGAVLFRLGVFLGALGRERIIVYPALGAGELPDELHGLAVATQPSAVKEHLRRLTTPLPPPAPPVARRRRRSLGTACWIRPGNELRIADISMTGALLESYGEIPVDQMLDLDVALENGRRIRVHAKVVRIQHPQWGRIGGIGVQFVKFEDGSREILEEFLEPDPPKRAA